MLRMVGACRLAAFASASAGAPSAGAAAKGRRMACHNQMWGHDPLPTRHAHVVVRCLIQVDGDHVPHLCAFSNDGGREG